MADKNKQLGRKKPNELSEIAELRRRTAIFATDPGRAIDSPWCVAHYLVASSILQFKMNTGRLPVLMHIPIFVEAALQVYMARELDEHDPICRREEFMNIPVCWNSDVFRLE